MMLIILTPTYLSMHYLPHSLYYHSLPSKYCEKVVLYDLHLLRKKKNLWR